MVFCLQVHDLGGICSCIHVGMSNLEPYPNILDRAVLSPVRLFGLCDGSFALVPNSQAPTGFKQLRQTLDQATLLVLKMERL